MRILLVRAKAEGRWMDALDSLITLEPLSLEYLGAAVCEHEVRILDMRLENGYAGLQQTLRDFKPDVVGASGQTCEVSACKRISSYAKGFDSRILTVVGGHHATFMPEEYCNHDIDVIVIGEGVFTLKEIVEHHERGQDLRDIKGIAIPEGDKLYMTGARPTCELDDLPLPDRSLTSHIRDRYSLSLWSSSIASIRTTQGCVHHCVFCPCWKMTGRRFLKRNIESVIEELKTIEESYVYTLDDEFFIDLGRARQLAQRIKEEHISKRYLLFARTDTICDHPDLFETWREIGLSEVFVGLDGINDEELSGIRKTTRGAATKEALAILAANDITCISSILVQPTYGRQEFQNMWNYAAKLKLESPAFQVMTPSPGSDLFDQMEDQLTTRNWDLWDYTHVVVPTTLPVKEFYKEYRNLMEYNLQGEPLRYHIEKLAALSEDARNQAVAGFQKMVEGMELLWMDHEPAEVRV